MYNKNLLGKAGLTSEFEDGVKTFIEWAKGQRKYMDGDKIRIIMRLLVSLKCRRKPTSAGQQIHDRISQWANKILPFNHTLPGDYYRTKKLVKNLGLPIEKIHACKNGCMLYWKDDVDLEYCKFCGDARYKPVQGRDLHQKKSPYAILTTDSPPPEVVFFNDDRRAHNVACHTSDRGGADVSSIRCRGVEAF
ncbi:hypothetical protein Sango_0659700 [Sesamum angolense]|uniref:Uncharacterized protein n=1 Tax=Sesamum angolense TaxID=2727404 RepID=A0AAE2C2D2_9LAMI|nr:hypothetical protein Sango_0659700 [Sesamum angolense]